VAASADNPTYEEIKRVARQMTEAQLVEGRQLARDWINRHPSEPETPTTREK